MHRMLHWKYAITLQISLWSSQRWVAMILNVFNYTDNPHLRWQAHLLGILSIHSDTWTKLYARRYSSFDLTSPNYMLDVIHQKTEKIKKTLNRQSIGVSWGRPTRSIHLSLPRWLVPSTTAWWWPAFLFHKWCRKRRPFHLLRGWSRRPLTTTSSSRQHRLSSSK